MYSCEIDPYKNCLMHHGIKGQKWGVRRFENYDGSYTQAGLARYREMHNKRASAEKRYYDAKASENSSKEKLRSLKSDYKLAARNENNAYRSLKRDKRADKGKRMYSEGKTVTGYKKLGAAGSAVTSLGAGMAAAGLVLGSKGDVKMGETLFYAGLGSAALGGLISGVAGTKANTLRAYYGHSGFTEIKRKGG